MDAASKPRARVLVLYIMFKAVEGETKPGEIGQSASTPVRRPVHRRGLAERPPRCEIFAYNHDWSGSAQKQFEVLDTRPIELGSTILARRRASGRGPFALRIHSVRFVVGNRGVGLAQRWPSLARRKEPGHHLAR